MRQNPYQNTSVSANARLSLGAAKTAVNTISNAFLWTAHLGNTASDAGASRLKGKVFESLIIDVETQWDQSLQGT